jgi:hypothetical protein
MYYAEFKTHSVAGASYRYRHDARIYLNQFTGSRSDGRCLGAFIGKNPGSASGLSSAWGRIKEDTTLRLIRSVWLKRMAYRKVQAKPGDYVQILNLFYLCNPACCQAVRLANKHALYFPDPAEGQRFERIWWGIGDYDDAAHRLHSCVNRLLTSSIKNCQKHVFYDPRKNGGSGLAVVRQPSSGDFCKHPIGMPHDPLARVL